MKNVLERIRGVMIYFICFAFIGWIYEVVLFLYDDHIFVNRGFLYGPWLPVYGFGGMIIYYLFYRLKKKPVKIMKINIRPLLIFIYITITAVLVELTTTYICDLFKTDWKKLWLYSDDFMNFQGRIALVPGLKFGLIGLLGVYLIIPLIDKLKGSKKKAVQSLTYIIILLFIIDVIIHMFTGSTYAGPV
ncbi:MAG: putative ABC transporter permease [Bacilli bacterium]|nr:putative ABC transporter permease [Bacilli bacterium]